MFKLYKKLRPLDWVLLAVLLGLTVVQVWCTMLLVDYTREIIAAITRVSYGLATVNDIWYNGGMMLAVAAGSMAGQVLVGLIAASVSTGLSARIRTEVYNKVDGFSIAERDRFSTPSLITRTTNDVQQVQMANILMLRMAVAAPVTAIWAVVKIQTASTQLTIATAVAVVALVLFLAVLMIFVMPKFRIMQKLIDKLNGVSRENLTGIRVIRAYNAEDYQEKKFEAANETITKAQLFTGRMMSMMWPVMILIMNGISLAIYWLGASLINKGETDYATVAAFMQLASQIIMAFMMLMMMFVILPRAQVSAKRINEVLATPLSVCDPEEELPLTEEGTVECKDVSFEYSDSDEKVIQNISFKANKGETVAFIGSTGSGKSTLINLVPRFFDATEGQVLVDGVDVKNLKQSTLRRLIGYVAVKPEIFIFEDSFSALDYKTDKQVRANLKEAVAGATKLIVAQRIGTIMDADKIIVLDSGKAVGCGTHGQLLKDCKVYREIALSQLSEEELGL